MATLNWIGKEAVVGHHREVPYHLLRGVPELSVGEDGGVGSGNLLVQGDNLLALKALLPYYAGRVKCIYIDPPYNTGNEGWVYNDNVNSPEIRQWLGKVVGKEGETLDRHDRWLCMMYPRLALLKEFLTEDGAIFVSIDDNEVQNLRGVMDEVFGQRNFVAQFIWEKRKSPDNDETFATAVHDYVVSYAKSVDHCRFNRLKRTAEANARYENPDNDPRGPWTSSDLTRREYRAHDFYEIELPSGRKVTPATGRSWGVPPESFAALRADNRIWFGPHGDAMPRRKRFLSEVSDGMVPTTWFSSDLCGDNQAAKRELKQAIPDVPDLFQTPKPLLLLERILEIGGDRDSIILDSFAGSGTTGHAALKMNAEDGGTRRFLLVEIDPQIADQVTARRVRHAASTLVAEGGGFRYVTLGEPLFNERGQVRAGVKFADLAAHVFFTETGEPLPKKVNGKRSPLIGVCRGTAYYLLFNGILGDKRPDGGNVLTGDVLAELPQHPSPGPDGRVPRVVFGEACRLGAARLKREGVTFRQIPYQIKVS